MEFQVGDVDRKVRRRVEFWRRENDFFDAEIRELREVRFEVDPVERSAERSVGHESELSHGKGKSSERARLVNDAITVLEVALVGATTNRAHVTSTGCSTVVAPVGELLSAPTIGEIRYISQEVKSDECIRILSENSMWRREE